MPEGSLETADAVAETTAAKAERMEATVKRILVVLLVFDLRSPRKTREEFKRLAE